MFTPKNNNNNAFLAHGAPKSLSVFCFCVYFVKRERETEIMFELVSIPTLIKDPKLELYFLGSN